MSQESKPWVYLAPKPKSSYKQLFVKGTRITARTLYGLYMSRDEPEMTPEEIATEFSLPVEAVLESIEYCRADPPEIREDFAREERLMEARGMNDPEYKASGRIKPLSPEDYARIVGT